jgi:hypothetical protein
VDRGALRRPFPWFLGSLGSKFRESDFYGIHA